jgi:hypothetical protein
MPNSFAYNLDISTHFSNEILTYAQAKSRSMIVSSLVVSYHTKLDKELAEIFWANASAIILNYNLKGNIVQLIILCFLAI